MDALVGSERDKSNSSSTPVPSVANFWKEFDLEKERSVLDEQGLKIAENQENSQKNRRKLAESTRAFKKASAEEKLSMFNTLLKGYQEEVDNLTKRAKFGENAFLDMYQKLYEAPDPYPVLSSIVEKDMKLTEIDSENRKMKVELEEFRTEATYLKNQQATIRRLEERIRQLEQQMEEKVKEVVEIKQRSLAEENRKSLEVLKERNPMAESIRERLLSKSTVAVESPAGLLPTAPHLVVPCSIDVGSTVAPPPPPPVSPGPAAAIGTSAIDPSTDVIPGPPHYRLAQLYPDYADDFEY